MKRLRYFLLTLVLSLIGINNVFASTVISATASNTEVVKGTEVSVEINIKSDESIYACVFDITNNQDAELISSNGENNWILTKGQDGYMVEGNLSNDNLSVGVNVLKLKYKVNNTTSVSIKTKNCVTVSEKRIEDIADAEVSFNAIEAEVKPLLTDIEVNNGTLSPDVTSDRFNYTINLSSKTFGLNLTANDEKYQDNIVVKDVDGKVVSDWSNITYDDPSGQGMMQLTIIVGDETTYNLNVVYEQKKYDNSLEWISINNDRINLDSCVNYYCKYTVDKDVSSVTIAAVVKDKENFELDDASTAPGTFSIKDSVIALIVVKPKDTKTGATAVTYEIEIVKEGTSVEEDKPVVPEKPTKPSGGSNVNNNPGTSDVPMLLMALILVVSLVSSIVLYKKNLENYK